MEILPVGLFQSQGIGGQDHLHDVCGPLKNFVDLSISKDPRDRIFVGVAIGA